MPTSARMLVRLRTQPDDTFLQQLRKEFMREMNLSGEDFYSGGPFVTVSREDTKRMPVIDDRSTWLDVNMWSTYFGAGYLRGDGEFFIKCGAWLERQIPGCEVYYGHDLDDENITRFDQAARDELLKLTSQKVP